jgi:hypothetical protein
VSEHRILALLVLAAILLGILSGSWLFGALT